MGRPPTSGYCGTCRKRRIKCDKARPACARCLKSGYVCKGYELGLRIQSLVVVTEPEGSQRLARIVLPPSNQQRTKLARSEQDFSEQHHVHRELKALGPPPELNLTAFQEHMAFSYFFATYGWAYFWKPFLQLARENDLAPTASHMCSLALAYGHMGIGHADKSLRSMGLELYGKSLREVQTLLTRGAEAKVELARLCVPIVILGMYSFAIDGDFRLIHNLGVAQILKHCGPEAFQEEPLLTAFRSCRALLICQSFAIRRRIFLEEPRWKTVPWEKVPKTSLDRLIDILAEMPGIVNDMAASEHPISPKTRSSFHQKVGQLRTQLTEWRSAWEKVNPNAGHEVCSNLKLHKIDTVVFREQLATMIEFDTTQLALEMLTYNAGLIYLLQLEDHLHIGQPHNAPLTTEDMSYLRTVRRRKTSSPLLLPGEVKFVCQPALEAFRLIPSLYKNLITTKDRIMVILAPLGIVYCATKHNAELSRCMQAVLDDIPFFGGGPPKELALYELSLGKAWKSMEPEPIPAGSTSCEVDYDAVALST
ncbi:hypothetical protein N0V82_004889 [Gnomoniopsis sp. IMI 355080]|nr:hypothetical protein N0V82_004889 [Gnomoniopsis sp. IMI 355080]